MANEVHFPSIAARKAARKKTLLSDSSPSRDSLETRSTAMGGQTLESIPSASLRSEIAAPVHAAPAASTAEATAAPPPTIEPFAGSPVTTNIRPSAPGSAQDHRELSRDMLQKLASQFGLKLTPERREFIKHTYSITPDRKEKMKLMSDSLGFNLQDSVCEAFDLFFEKHKASFDAISKAKKAST